VAGHVFVSYSRDDRDYVQRLVGHLRSAGVAVWVDHDIDHGDRWLRRIKTSIDEAVAFVLVMSPAAEESEWVLEEVRYARSRGIPVLTLLLVGEVLFGLGQLQHEDVSDGRMPSAQFVQRLRTAMTSVPTDPPANKSVPAPPHELDAEENWLKPSRTGGEAGRFPYADLANGERVALHFRPIRRTGPPPMWAVGVTVGVAAVSVFAPLSTLLRTVLLTVTGVAALIAAGWLYLWPWLIHTRTHYVFTSVRVRLKVGVLAVHTRDVPLSAIRRVTVNQTPTQRLDGSGSLVLDSRGERSQTVLLNLPKVAEVRRVLEDLIDYSGR
jgi:membrane protein YdbS with pleckstrin-like domain